MRKVRIVHIGLLLLCGSFLGLAQEGYVSTSRNMQFINPSYHGINMVSKAGVYYSQFDFGDGTSYIDNKYLYGNFAFEEMNFRIGLDVISFSLTNLGLPKTKIELAVKDEDAQSVIDAISSVSNSGKVGDGKIFVYNLENVIRIRTGESGEEAL